MELVTKDMYEVGDKVRIHTEHAEVDAEPLDEDLLGTDQIIRKVEPNDSEGYAYKLVDNSTEVYHNEIEGCYPIDTTSDLEWEL